jgi:hypothetical protein
MKILNRLWWAGFCLCLRCRPREILTQGKGMPRIQQNQTGGING